MKVYSAVKLAVARWRDQARSLLDCLGADAEVTSDKLRALKPKASTLKPSSPLAARYQLLPLTLHDADQPPLSSRSSTSSSDSIDSIENAAENWLKRSPGCDGSPADLSFLVGDDQAAALDAVGTDSIDSTDAEADADPECEPDLGDELESGSKAVEEAGSTSSGTTTDEVYLPDFETAAVALAQQFVLPTTATGRFSDEPDLSQDAAATPDQWKQYLSAKATFAATAQAYVVAGAGRDAQGADDERDTAALVDAYVALSSLSIFDAEQRAIDRQWHDAQALVNAAAFSLVHLAVEVPGPEPLVQTVSPAAGQRPLTALEQRLDDAQALTLFRKTPETLARSPSAVFDHIDTDQLCLLELRALAHAAALPSTSDRECRKKVTSAVRAAKEQFDAQRREHWGDVRSSSSSGGFFHEPTSAQVLPLYASVSAKIAPALTSYCDAEVATH